MYQRGLLDSRQKHFVTAKDFDKYVNHNLKIKLPWIDECGSKARKKALVNAENAFKKFFERSIKGGYPQQNMKGCALQACRRSLSENLRSGSSPSAADQAAEEKRRKVADNDRRAHGGGEQIRPREPEAEAHDRERRGEAHDRAEALEHPHRGQRREDDEARVQPSRESTD